MTVTSTAILTSDLSGCTSNGLILGADGITLDCQGHVITGNTASGSNGILVTNRTRTTIVNCVLKSFDTGVRLTGSNLNQIKMDSAQGVNGGFYLDHSNNNTVTSNTATGLSINNGGDGFKLLLSSNNTVVSNSASDFASGFTVDSQIVGPGGQLITLPSFNILRSNTASVIGYDLTARTSFSQFLNNTGCELDPNSNGFQLTNSNNNLLDGNAICSTVDGGLTLSDSNNNTVRSNLLIGNQFGIALFNSTNNLIYNNLFNSETDVVEQGSNHNFWNITKTLGRNIAGGPNLGGNYWLSYTGNDTNADGLGDTGTPFHPPGSGAGELDYLPACPPLGCPVGLKNSFELDWSDYDNNGKVTILDIAQVAFVYGQPSSYWDLYLISRVNINDVAIVAFHYGQSSWQGSFLGQGQPAGRMDPVWKQLCNLLPSTYRLYCSARI